MHPSHGRFPSASRFPPLEPLNIELQLCGVSMERMSCDVTLVYGSVLPIQVTICARAPPRRFTCFDAPSLFNRESCVENRAVSTIVFTSGCYQQVPPRPPYQSPWNRLQALHLSFCSWELLFFTNFSFLFMPDAGRAVDCWPIQPRTPREITEPLSSPQFSFQYNCVGGSFLEGPLGYQFRLGFFD